MKLELSHDILANRIYNKASTEDKMQLKVQNFIKNRFEHFKDNSVLMSKEDLDYIRPYIKNVILLEHERIFIQRSKNFLWLKRAALALVAIGVIFTIAYFMNKTKEVKNKSAEKMRQELARYRQLESRAEEISDSLVQSREGLHATKKELHLTLIKLQKKNDTLLHAYATYKVEQEMLAEELNIELHIAQSSKLSELAAAAPDNNKRNAFQLAVKAWELNHDNKQAIDIIYKLGGKSSSRRSDNLTKSIIKDKQKTYGKLSSKEMNAIFNAKNNVVCATKQQFDEQIKKAGQQASNIKRPIPKQQLEQKIQIQTGIIQQQIQQQIKQGPIQIPR